MRKYKFDALAIEITRRCNKACVHCGRGDAQNLTITESIIDQIIDDVKDVKSIVLFSGEMLLELDRIEYLIQKLNGSHWTTNYLELTTNGTVLDKRIIDVYESFCMVQNNRLARLRISNDQYHNATEYRQAWAFYEPLVVEANARIKKAGSKSRIVMQYVLDVGDEIDNLIYSGRAKTLIDSGEHPHWDGKAGYPYPYSHRIKIKNDTIPCTLQICSNGNVTFDEDLDYDAMDAISIGNIMDGHLSEIIDKHNDNCMLLCSEASMMRLADYGKKFLPFEEISADHVILAFEVKKLIYQRILELRYKARELFPKLPACRIIEALPFPKNAEEQGRIIEEIYQGYEFANQKLMSVLYEDPSAGTKKYGIRLAALLRCVLVCLKDRSRRRSPYNLLGDENDIVESSAFQYLRWLNDECCNIGDNSKNFKCEPTDDNELDYSEDTEKVTKTH